MSHETSVFRNPKDKWYDSNIEADEMRCSYCLKLAKPFDKGDSPRFYEWGYNCDCVEAQKETELKEKIAQAKNMAWKLEQEVNKMISQASNRKNQILYEAEVESLQKKFKVEKKRKFMVYLNAGGIMEKPDYTAEAVREVEADTKDEAVQKWAELTGHTDPQYLRKLSDGNWRYYYDIIVREVI